MNTEKKDEIQHHDLFKCAFECLRQVASCRSCDACRHLAAGAIELIKAELGLPDDYGIDSIK